MADQVVCAVLRSASLRSVDQPSGAPADPVAFGRALKRAREAFVDPDTGKPITMRGAARRTNASSSGKRLSEPRWRQYEKGVQYRGGQAEPNRPTPGGVAAAARAVGWDVAEALCSAGFDPHAHPDLLEPDDYPGDTLFVPGLSRLGARHRQLLVAYIQGIVELPDEPTGVRPGMAPADIAERGTVLGRGDTNRDAGAEA
jgi:hypothetical protein